MAEVSARGSDVRHIIQGHFDTSSNPETMFATVLGSCVCACIYDDVAQIGGMNHFLLGLAPSGDGQDLKYGLHAMELLINQLLKQGARRDRLKAKLFGGANMLGRSSSIGEKNAAFAVEFVENEDIELTGHSLGGIKARRVRFWPTTGRSQQLLVENSVHIIEQENNPVVKPEGDSGSVDLF